MKALHPEQQKEDLQQTYKSQMQARKEGKEARKDTFKLALTR